MTAPLRIGMDIGGTKTEAVAIDASGGVVATTLLPTPPGIEPVLQTAEQAIADLAAQTDRAPGDFASVGVGIPGQVRLGTGEVLHAYNIGIERLDLAGQLSARTGLPVALDNDVNAAALGAAHLMGLGGTVAYLNLGTGIATGLVIDGQLQRGANGVTGEIGHLAIDPLNRQCPCGQRGCLETAASGAALRTFWPAGGEHPGRTLLPAVDAGDGDAADAFAYLVRGAASAVKLLVLLLDPDTVVIGGGLRLIGSRLFNAIEATLIGWADESQFLAELRIAERMSILPQGSPAAAVGAALAGAEQPARDVIA